MTTQEIQSIIEVSAGRYGVTTEEVLDKGRPRRAVDARHAAMYVLWKRGLTLQAVAEAVGRKDHTTAYHAREKLLDQMAYDADIRRDIEAIESSIPSSPPSARIRIDATCGQAAWSGRMRHFRQPEPYGCTYYALASLTGDASLLRYAKDASFPRFLLRAQRAGWHITPVHATAQSTREPTTSRFWQSRTWVMELGVRYAYLLTIRSLKYRAVDHVVGLSVEYEPALDQVAMIVTDPGQPHAIYYGKEEFLRSPYAAALDVMRVLPANLRVLQPKEPAELEPLPDAIDPLAMGGTHLR